MFNLYLQADDSSNISNANTRYIMETAPYRWLSLLRHSRIRSAIGALMIFHLTAAPLLFAVQPAAAQGGLRKVPQVAAPVWATRALTQRVKAGHIKPSAALRRRAQRVSFQNLLRNEVPTEAQLRAAGQSEGELFPTGIADLNLLAKEIDNSNAPRVEKDARLKSLRRMNAEFGEAVREWNGHNYEKAVKLFQTYAQENPDSPWTAEALLHLGKHARLNGRFTEAQDHYNRVLNSASDNPEEASYDVAQKAKQLDADLSMAQGNFNDAEEQLKDILGTEQNWRRVAWATHWLRNVGMYQKNARDLRACGAEALSVVLAKLGKDQASEEVLRLRSQSSNGFSLAELSTVAKEQGIEMLGARLEVQDLSELPLPLVIHCGQADKTQSSGHFVVVEGVDAVGQRIRAHDPQARRVFELTFEQLQKEWTGAALVRATNDAKRTVLASRLPENEMRRVMGGAGDVSLQMHDLGDPGNGGIGDGAIGAPSWAVNAVSLNQYVEDSLIGYGTPAGPDVGIDLSFNSQDSDSQNTIFGNKWTFNYGSYLRLNADNSVTIFMPDGEQVHYGYDGSGYVPPAGVYDKLERTTTTGLRFELLSPEGDKWIYDAPAGTNVTVPLLVAATDRWGLGLTFIYNSDAQLTTIRDAQNKNTTLVYDASGQVVRVDDPFDRHAYFTYDTNGNLVQTIDQAGQTTQYVYDSVLQLLEINSNAASWEFSHQLPQRDTYEQLYLKSTDLLGNNQLASYEGDGGPVSFTDERGFTSRSHIEQVSNDGEGLVTQDEDPDEQGAQYSYDPVTAFLKTATSPLQKRMAWDYNAQGNVTRVTDPKKYATRINYLTNGHDVSSVVNAKNETEVEYSNYNAAHQPQTVTGADGQTTQLSYTGWGAIETAADASGTTTFHYDPTKQLQKVTDGNTIVAQYTYDRFGDVETVKDIHGLTTSYEYDDETGDVLRVNYPDQTHVEYQYIAPGLVGLAIDRDGSRTYYDYDPLQRLRRVQDAQGNVTRFYYDKAGNMTKLVDAKEQETIWKYDNQNRVIKKIYADGNSEGWSYNEDGQLITYKKGDGKLIRYEYDDNGNTTLVDYPTSPDVRMFYNELDELREMHDAVGVSTFAYDKAGRLISEDGPWENDTVSYKYDALGRREWMKIGGSFTTSYEWDNKERLRFLNSPAGRFEYQYEGDTDQINKLIRPNGSYTNYGYDDFKRLTEVHNRKSSGSTFTKFEYEYNELDQKKWAKINMPRENGSLSVHQDYTYDKIGQLTKIQQQTVSVYGTATSPTTYTGLSENSYHYDQAGNLVKNQGTLNGATPTTYSAGDYNLVNQKAGALYDANGNPIGNGMPECKFDDNNQLIQVITRTLIMQTVNGEMGTQGTREKVVPVNKYEYIYDGFGRLRVSRRFDWVNSQWVAAGHVHMQPAPEKRRIYDGLDIVQERDGENGITASLTRGLDISGTLSGAGGIGGILAFTHVKPSPYINHAPPGHYYPLYDAQGSLDSFSGYGTTSLMDASENRAVVTTFSYWFSCKEFVLGAGTNFGYRFGGGHLYNGINYTPAPGRWLTRDPLREAGGLNLYAYCDNDPINKIDPYGLNPSQGEINHKGSYGAWADSNKQPPTQDADPSAADDYKRGAQGLPSPFFGGSGRVGSVGRASSAARGNRGGSTFVNPIKPSGPTNATKAGPKSKPYRPKTNLSKPTQPNKPPDDFWWKRNRFNMYSTKKRAKDARPKFKPPKSGGKRVTNQTRKKQHGIGKSAKDKKEKKTRHFHHEDHETGLTGGKLNHHNKYPAKGGRR